MRVELGLTEATLVEAASVLSDAFAEYPVEISFTPQSLRSMCEADDVVFDACALARRRDGRLLGVGLGALRGRCGRVAAMGVARDAHRQGIGQALGEAVVSSLRSAGARSVVLEALTVNKPALTLYEQRLRFTRRRRLIGFSRPAGSKPIGQARWDDALSQRGEPDSWQLARVVSAARSQVDLTSVPAVIPERHPVARLLQDEGFSEAPIDQYELERRL
jgi:GNAT superfamily N-acetyltransferase